MPTRRLISCLAAGLLLFGAGTASADLVDIIEVSRTGDGPSGGTATFEVYLNSGTDTVGAGQLYYYFDNIGQWDAGASSLTGFESAFPGFWITASGFPGAYADLQIGGAQFGGAQPINQLWAEFTVAWLPGTTSLKLLISVVPGQPTTTIIDGTAVPIPGIIPMVIQIVPEPSGAVCGNGLTEEGEQCDDGNPMPCDGCSPHCQLEGFCGDDDFDSLCEECDDGNNDSGDGCSSDCELEYCGDGILQPGLGEECDDGNTRACDGCSGVCAVEGHTDPDSDGIDECEDPCPSFSNVDLTDRNRDRIPDECQCGDTDGDGWLTPTDAFSIVVCGNNPNAPQCASPTVMTDLWDTDLDGVLTVDDGDAVLRRGLWGGGYLNTCPRRPEGTPAPLP